MSLYVVSILTPRCVCSVIYWPLGIRVTYLKDQNLQLGEMTASNMECPSLAGTSDQQQVTSATLGPIWCFSSEPPYVVLILTLAQVIVCST